MNQEDSPYSSRIQKLEEELTFLDEHVSQQDQEILNLQKKIEKTVLELKELREHLQSGSLSTTSGDEKPPHY